MTSDISALPTELSSQLGQLVTLRVRNIQVDGEECKSMKDHMFELRRKI